MGKRPRAIIPQEYAAVVILPLVRGAVANMLSEEGYSQHSIGRVLGISQPMVHKYLSLGLDHYLDHLDSEGVPRDKAWVLLEAARDAVKEGDYTSFASAVNLLTLYSSYCKSLQVHCRAVLCVEGDPEKLYKLVLERIIRIRGLQNLIPEVGSNLAYAPRSAESVNDVIGLEGRIVKTSRGRVLAAGDPLPGGSRHVGRVALEARDLVGGEAWAFAVKGSNEVITAARSSGVVLGGPGRVVGVVEAGEGVEPVLYILAGDPWELVSTLRRMAEKLG